jgi:membrane protease YdiL (CAAX protease family)
MARVVILIEGVILLVFVAVPSLLARASPVVSALTFVGAAVLLWGGIRMRGDTPMHVPPRSDFVELRRVPWDWTDFLMFWPGAFTAASLLVSLIVPLIHALTGSADSSVRTAAESFAQQASFYGGAVFNIWVLVGLRRGGSLYHLGWRRFQWWWVVIAVVAAAATLEIADWLQVVSQHLFPGAQNTQCQAVQHDYSHFIALAVIVVCVMAPLAEETVFRGFVFGWLYRFMPSGLAILISGAIFGGLHGVLLLFIPLWAVGIILALMYRGSGSLWPGAMVHALFNLPGIIAILTSPTC